MNYKCNTFRGPEVSPRAPSKSETLKYPDNLNTKFSKNHVEFIDLSVRGFRHIYKN